MTLKTKGSQFELGRIVITRRALEELPLDVVCMGLDRHRNSDWGDADSIDREQNDLALTTGDRVISRFESKTGTVFLIVTEYDRSVTTVLLPSDY